MNTAKEKQKQLKELMQYLVILFVALIISLFVVSVVTKKYHPVFVSGSSMNPTYKNGNILVSTVDFEYNELEIGDIVVFKKGKQMIKRIVAKEGDIVYICDGLLYVNDELSPYQFEDIEDAGMLSEPYKVKENELFCLGDNRNHSNDSRKFGPVAFNEVRFKITGQLF